MAENIVHQREQLKEARKLQELFKGRFSEEESLELLEQQGSLGDAVDFVLNGDPADVRTFINNRNETLVNQLQRDSDYVTKALEEGVEATIRLFACGSCDRFWWRKVPTRKEVSKCGWCKVKYERVPQHEEWGLAEFACNCGNIFLGAGWMSHTQSPCYSCCSLVTPRQIIPPSSRPQVRKNRKVPHSCTGKNCYNRAHGQPALLSVTETWSPRMSGRGGAVQQQRPPPDQGSSTLGSRDWKRSPAGMDKEGPWCTHEQSVRGKRVLFPSRPHVSTGSTVDTFMSQGELMENYQQIMQMPSVPELEDD